MTTAAGVLDVRASFPASGRQVTLLDLLDRLLEGGVVVHGDITLAVADIDLVDISLSLVLGAVDTVARAPR